MRVVARIEEIEIENDYGRPIESIRAVCTRCQHATESFGTSDASIKRCLVMLREECPKREHNYYAVE